MSEKVLMKGNEALSEAAIIAGCRHFFGYPITPQNELAAYMSRRMPKVNGTYLQAESEIAAINMVLGASGAGARVMTSSSSPGIALKSEGLSYLAGCDLPAVLANVQRGGPGLGGIQPGQADYFLAVKSAGHGDFRMIVLAPCTIQEMVDCTIEAFDLADKYRMTSMLLLDGVLGQMMEPVIFPEASSSAVEKPWALTGTGMKRKHNIVNSLFLSPEELERVNIERFKKYALVEENEVKYDSYMLEDADIVIAAYGASARVARNAIDMAREKGIKAGLLRPITLWPFPKKVFFETAKRAKAFLTVEMSMGQMIEDVKLAIECSKPVGLCSRCGGMIPTPENILEELDKLMGGLK